MSNQATKFHPILFSTPMVQAIQEGRKYKTRRTKGLESINENPDAWKYVGIAIIGNIPVQKNEFRIYHWFEEKATGEQELVKCPYELGDVLWVRETFRAIEQEVGAPRFEYKATEKINLTDKWKPSIFMPKEACRTFLKIKSIRVERLQSIDYKDAIKEGVEMKIVIEDNVDIPIQGWTNYLGGDYFTSGDGKNTPEERSFLSLWQSINGKESLEQNPFVWVYEFEKIEKPLDFI